MVTTVALIPCSIITAIQPNAAQQVITAGTCINLLANIHYFSANFIGEEPNSVIGDSLNSTSIEL